MIRRLASDLPTFARLAAPLVLASAGSQIMGVVDTAIMGRVGAVELAGTCLANTILFSSAAFALGLMAAFEPLMTQAIGASQRGRVRVLWGQSIWLAIALGGATTLLVAAVHSLASLGAFDEATLAEARTYLVYRLPSLVPMLVSVSARILLQSHQITRPLLVSTVVANLVNLLSGVLLVHGGASLPAWVGPLQELPAMGVAGAGLTSTAATFVQLAVLVHAIQRLDWPVGVPRRPSLRSFAPVFRVGVPVGAQTVAEMGGFALVALFALRFGPEAMAAHNVALTLAILFFSMVQGVAAAGTVRVGRSIGARDLAGTRRAAVLALSVGGLTMSGVGLGFWLAPELLARTLTNDPEVVARAGSVLFVAACFQVFDGLKVIAEGLLRGAGDTRVPLLVNIVAYYLLGLPCALVLGFVFELGIAGLWLGMSLGIAVAAVVLCARLNRLTRAPIDPIAQPNADLKTLAG